MTRPATLLPRVLLACLALILAGAAAAQEAWVQIEARPTEDAALDRARVWEDRVGPLAGFRLRTGWHALALGPFTEAGAAAELARLRAAGSVPSDAFVADGSAFVARFYTSGAGVRAEDAGDTVGEQGGTVTIEDLAAALRAADPEGGFGPGPDDTVPGGDTLDTSEPDDTVIETLPPIVADDDAPARAEGRTPTQSVAEARAAERGMTRADRARLQRALDFAGVYEGRIDADFGPATRRAMSAWQRQQGFPETGVMTVAQRRQATDAMDAALADLALTRVADPAAGIAVEIPARLIDSRREDPPFVVFGEDGGLQVRLISQPGGFDRLAGLYAAIQTLPEVPKDGPRSQTRVRFEIEGEAPAAGEGAAAPAGGGADRTTPAGDYAWVTASTDGEAVKGVMLTWPADEGDPRRRALLRRALDASFETTDGVLPDPAEDMSAALDLAPDEGALRPVRTAAGFAVDTHGRVLTTAAAVEGCGRITLGGAATEASVQATAPDIGAALLSPAAAMPPARIAALSPATPADGTAVAVAGYPYGGALTRPALTWGRLSGGGVSAPLGAGDAGAPVLAEDGTVAGLLGLPRGTDAAPMTDAAALSGFLSGAGVETARPAASAPLAPEDLTEVAAALTVPVACWP